MINETIFNGLIEALARGDSLQNAMFSFYNAGYGKQEIEEAARELYKQTGGQAEKMINPKKPLQEEKPKIKSEEEKKISESVEKPRVPEEYFRPEVQIPTTPAVKPEPKPEVKKEVKKEAPIIPKSIPKPVEQPKPEVKKEIKPEPKPVEQPKPEVKVQPKPEIKKDNRPPQTQIQPVQIISQGYREPDESVEELNNRIESAISTLRNVRLPSKIEIINLEAGKKSPSVLQRVSDYNWDAPKKQAGEWVVVVLIILFILLLGALVSVFLFKEQLIDFFNSHSLG